MNKKNRRNMGYTLIEIIIASAIFLTFLTAIFILYVQAIRSYRFGEVRIRLVQDARVCMDRISMDLKKARLIVFPDEKVLFSEGSSMILFTSIISRETGDATFPTSNRFGFRYDVDKKTVEWMLYQPDFDLEKPEEGKVMMQRTIGRNIESLQFKYEQSENPQLVTIRLKTIKRDKDQVSLMTRVFIRY